MPLEVAPRGQARAGSRSRPTTRTGPRGRCAGRRGTAAPSSRATLSNASPAASSIVDPIGSHRRGHVADPQQRGVPAGDEQGEARVRQGAVLELVDRDVGGEVVDAVERLVEPIASAFAAATPTSSAPARPGPAVTASASTSASATPAVSQARSIVGTIASRWAREATSGTTPPKRACSSTDEATASASSVVAAHDAHPGLVARGLDAQDERLVAHPLSVQGVDLHDDARAMRDDLVRLRRELHRTRRSASTCPARRRRCCARSTGCRWRSAPARRLTSVTAVLRGGARDDGDPDGAAARRHGRAAGHRAAAGLAFAATDGAMHACGHDLHTASLVGAARLLARTATELPGDVVFMFQPGEEGWDGAGRDDRGGRARRRRPARSTRRTALHVFVQQFRAGPVRQPARAADGRLATGCSSACAAQGGHGSTPAPRPRPDRRRRARWSPRCRRWSPARFDVFDPVVITVGIVARRHAAQHHPRRRARFEATVRSLLRGGTSAAARAASGDTSARASRAAHGLEVDARYDDEYPLTVNDAAEDEFVADVVREVFGEERFDDLPDPITGSEDFSRVLERGARRVRLPRRHAARPRPGDGARRTTARAPTSTPRCSPTRRPSTPSSRSGSSRAPPADLDVSQGRKPNSPLVGSSHRFPLLHTRRFLCEGTSSNSYPGNPPPDATPHPRPSGSRMTTAVAPSA